MAQVVLFHSVLGLRHAGHFYTDTTLPDHSDHAATLTWRRALEFVHEVSR